MILIAVEINGYVMVYSKNKTLLFKKFGFLYNYTENYVAIARNDAKTIIDIYDDKSKLVCTYPKDLVDTSNIQGMIF